jgi:hypothetical protein
MQERLEKVRTNKEQKWWGEEWLKTYSTAVSVCLPVRL